MQLPAVVNCTWHSQLVLLAVSKRKREGTSRGALGLQLRASCPECLSILPWSDTS
jgi:hypothetical protein